MKKFLTLLSAAFVVVASFATVASAAPMTSDNFEPKVVVEISSVSAGYAVADITLEVKNDLAVKQANPPLPLYTGQAITDAQVDVKFDGEMFDIASALPMAGSAGVSYNETTDVFCGVISWGSTFGNIVQSTDKKVAMGTVWLPLKGEYANKTADDLNSLDFATVSYAEIIIGDWANVGQTALKSFTTFRTDGKGDFLATSRVGAEVVEPPVDNNNYGEAGNEFEGKASKYWTVEFAEWTGSADVSLTDGTDTKTINVTTAEGSEDYVIGGAVSFYVYVIGDADAIENVYIVE